jgi:hypothetical protein
MKKSLASLKKTLLSMDRSRLQVMPVLAPLNSTLDTGDQLEVEAWKIVSYNIFADLRLLKAFGIHLNTARP